MPTMATAHLVRVAVVILCWETFATAHVTKYTVEYHKYPVEVQLDETRQMAMVTPPDTAGFLKYKTLHDYNTKITAYKDLEKSLCYLERIKDTDGRIKHQMRQFRPQRQSYRMRDKPRTMYVSDKNLSKYEVWRVAGSRISSFCHDFPATLLQEMRPQFRKGIVNNELPDQEELQVLEPQTGDAFLQQVKGRRKRQTYTTRGYSRRHRGQTQTQYLAFQNGGNEGKAEAESSPDLSRTHVSGTNGMGQAQSQSGQGNGCEGCFPGGYGYGTQPGQFDYVPGAPQPVYQQPVRVPGAPSEVPRAPGVGVLTGVPGIQIPDGIPGIGVPSVGVPSIGVPGAQIPGVGVPGARLPTAQIPGFGVPGVGAPGVGVPRIGVPTVQIPGAGLPGAQIPGFGIPGVGAPGVGAPGPQIPGFGAPGVGGPGAQIPGVGTPGVPGPQISVFGVPGVGAQIPGVGAPGAQIPGFGIPGGAPGVRVPTVQIPGVGAPGPQIPGFGAPGVGGPGAQIPGVGAPGVPGPQIPVFGVPGLGAQIPGVGVPGAQIPGFGIPGVGVPTVQIPGVGAPGPQIPGFGAPGVGGPGAQIPGVGAPGVPGPQIPVFGVPGVGAQIPGVGAPGAQIPGVGAPGPQIPGFGIPGVGAPGVGVPVGTLSTQIQGVGVPGIGAPTAQISGVGVPGIHIPGAGVPGPPVTGIYQQPTGVSGVGIPVQLGIYHPSLGVPGGVTGVAPPGIITYQPGLYQQPGIRTPTQVGYPGDIYQQLGGGTVTQPGYVQPGGLGQVGGVYTGQDAYQTVGYTAAGDSQAESNVKQEDNETRAAASAQGKYGGGTAQTQVSGIYSGTGAFSAQAQTSDKDRGAQSQVIGGKEGASSTAQGQAGNGKTQSQVQLGSSSGATTAEAQSGGVYYGTNTQVQAGSQGGMADAQSKGQGSTSSQAQIGFTPYQKDRKTNGQKSPFHGGGSASAQSGAYSGQSQSQIQGSFLHGISYTGGAQAGSGQTSYSRTASSNYENFGGKLGLVQSGSRNGIPQNGRTSISNGQQSGYQQFGSLNNSPSSHVLSEQRTHEDGSAGQEVVTSPHHSDHMRDYNDETTRQPDAYTGTETGSQHRQTSNFGIARNENGRAQQGGYRIQTYDATVNDTRHTGVPTQTQHIVLGPLNGRGAHVIQDVDDQDQYNPGDILQPGQTIHGTPEYTIPKGYRGRITSVASPQKTAAQGGQSQTVVVTPGVGNVTHTNPSAESYQPSVMSIPIGQQSVERSYDQSSQSGHAGTENTQLRNGGQQSISVRRNGGYSHRNGRTSRNGNHIRNGHSLNSYNQPTPDSFVTVTKSVTGQLDNGKSSSGTGKFTHTYYTKSSTCGYFTFSCNIVFGSNGRTKICKPNPPTNPDGTPCCC